MKNEEVISYHYLFTWYRIHLQIIIYLIRITLARTKKNIYALLLLIIWLDRLFVISVNLPIWFTNGRFSHMIVLRDWACFIRAHRPSPTLHSCDNSGNEFRRLEYLSCEQRLGKCVAVSHWVETPLSESYGWIYLCIFVIYCSKCIMCCAHLST